MNPNRSIKVYEFLTRKARPLEFGQFLKSLLAVRRREHKVGDRTYYIDPLNFLGYALLKFGTYQADVRKVLEENLKPGDTFIDLGANEGFFSVVASNLVGPDGRVLAIEPQARLWKVLIWNFELNDCANCQLLPFAISDTGREMVMTLTPDLNSGSSSIVESPRKRFWAKQKAHIKTLDELWPLYRLETVDLIKVDIEGFELFALRSAQEALKAGKIRKLLVELHPDQLKRLGQSSEEVADFLKSFGYTQSPDNHEFFYLP